MQPRPQATALFPGLGGGAGKRRPGDEVEGHVPRNKQNLHFVPFCSRSVRAVELSKILKKLAGRKHCVTPARVVGVATKDFVKTANRGRNSTNHKPQKRDTMRMRS